MLMPNRRWAHDRPHRAVLEGTLPGFVITARERGDHATVLLITRDRRTEAVLEATAATLDEAMTTGEEWADQLGLLAITTDREQPCTQH